MRKQDNRFTVRFPLPLLADIKNEAKARNITPSRLIKEILKEALEQQKAPAA
jgi:predicted DNA binding CopG/RHH family protein